MRTILPNDPSPPAPYVATRHDGWTTARQAHFLSCLARHGSVTAACDAVGKRSTSAYRLRRRPDTAAFAAAWDACLTPTFDARLPRPAPRRDVTEGGKGIEGQDFAPRHQLHQLRATPDDRRAWAEAIRRAAL